MKRFQIKLIQFTPSVLPDGVLFETDRESIVREWLDNAGMNSVFQAVDSATGDVMHTQDDVTHTLSRAPIIVPNRDELEWDINDIEIDWDELDDEPDDSGFMIP